MGDPPGKVRQIESIWRRQGYFGLQDGHVRAATSTSGGECEAILPEADSARNSGACPRAAGRSAPRTGLRGNRASPRPGDLALDLGEQLGRGGDEAGDEGLGAVEALFLGGAGDDAAAGGEDQGDAGGDVPFVL